MAFKNRKKPQDQPPATGPDFSSVDSLQKAFQLHKEGTLEILYLIPLDLGGEDNPLNIVYVPVGIAEIKQRIDSNVIGPLAEDGTVTKYAAEPEYQGESFIPIAINIRAWNPGEFSTQINIWGDALGRDGQS